jgi:hypothetical protein
MKMTKRNASRSANLVPRAPLLTAEGVLRVSSLNEGQTPPSFASLTVTLRGRRGSALVRKSLSGVADETALSDGIELSSSHNVLHQQSLELINKGGECEDFFSPLISHTEFLILNPAQDPQDKFSFSNISIPDSESQLISDPFLLPCS